MSRKVLFIDDDPHWREIATVALTDAGHQVLAAADATEAMQLAEGGEIGLIVLDLNLAGENGLMLMKYLGRNHPGVPILLFTGMEHDDAAVRSMLEQGADNYLQKRSIEELIVTVGGYFREFGGE